MTKQWQGPDRRRGPRGSLDVVLGWVIRRQTTLALLLSLLVLLAALSYSFNRLEQRFERDFMEHRCNSDYTYQRLFEQQGLEYEPPGDRPTAAECGEVQE